MYNTTVIFNMFFTNPKRACLPKIFFILFTGFILSKEGFKLSGTIIKPTCIRFPNNPEKKAIIRAGLTRIKNHIIACIPIAFKLFSILAISTIFIVKKFLKKTKEYSRVYVKIIVNRKAKIAKERADDKSWLLGI